VEKDELRAVAVARDLPGRADRLVAQQVVGQSRRHRTGLDAWRQVAVERREACLRRARTCGVGSLGGGLVDEALGRALQGSQRRRGRRRDARVEISRGSVEGGRVGDGREEGRGGRGGCRGRGEQVLLGPAWRREVEGTWSVGLSERARRSSACAREERQEEGADAPALDAGTSLARDRAPVLALPARIARADLLTL